MSSPRQHWMGGAAVQSSWWRRFAKGVVRRAGEYDKEFDILMSCDSHILWLGPSFLQGVGKSTVTVQVATGLVAAGKKVRALVPIPLAPTTRNVELLVFFVFSLSNSGSKWIVYKKDVQVGGDLVRQNVGGRLSCRCVCVPASLASPLVLGITPERCVGWVAGPRPLWPFHP